MCCCYPFHAEQGWGEDNRCLPTGASCELASSRGEKLGVGVQNVAGEFCKHVNIRVAFRMVLYRRLGAAPEP